MAIVTNVKDPDKQGRVKICLPRLPGKPESDWARVVQPAAGEGRGFYWLPAVNDEVLVAFERGQANRPFVIGSLWNGKDKPMKDGYTDDNTKVMVQTTSGHQVILEDKNGEETIVIADKSGKRTVTFDVKNKKFLIEAKEGDVEFHAEKKIVLQCEDIEIKTKKTGKVDIGDKFELKVAQKLAMKAGPQFNIKADKVNLNPPSLDLQALIAAALAAAARAAAAAAGANAAQQQAAAAAAAAAANALMNAATAGGTVPTKDVADAAKAAAEAAEAAAKAGAKAPDGTDWTKAKDGQKAGDDAAKTGGGATGGGTTTTGGDTGKTGGKDAGQDAAPGPHDIAVTLQDASGNPVPNIKWQVTLPDNSTKTGTTADDGKISVTGLTQDGKYTLDLPDLDKVSPPPSDDGGTQAKGGDDKPKDDKSKDDGSKTDSPAQGDTSSPAQPKDDAGPQDDEAKRYDWVRSIIESTDIMDWKKKESKGKGKFDTNPWDMNLLGLRGWHCDKGAVPNVQDRFNDTIYVAYLDDSGKKCCEAFQCTVDPGKLGDKDLKKIEGSWPGVAHLLDNQYRYKRGQHPDVDGKLKHAMRQAAPVWCWFSSDQHDVRKESDPIIFGGDHKLHDWGVNIHFSYSAAVVGNWSEGCQVIHSAWKDPPFQRFLFLMSKDPDG
ncbi:MAG: phage baseplate assembly protein V, partial [Myxococcales bacterium]|nr:phage baseplate assembly protein V [Myxococcales bacterium]